MAKAKMTLLGMTKYLEDGGDDLFAQMNLPAGIDRQTFIDTVLMRGGEFELLFAEPSTMQYAIGTWSRKWQHTLTKWSEALQIKYNPLENYDRYESWSDDKTGNDSRNGSNSKNGSDFRNESDERTGSNKQSGNSSDVSVTTNDQTRTNDRAAYDSSSYSPLDKESVDGKGSNSSNTNTSTEGTNAENGKRSEAGGHAENGTHSESGSHAENALHTGRMHGNIGVTTSQQMLQSEWEVARLNIYESAAELFLTELCIYTY